MLLDNEIQGDLTLVIDGTLSMTSADARLDGEYGGRLEAHIGTTGAIDRIEFMLDDTKMSNVALGGAYYGFPNEDISTFDAAGVSVGLTVSANLVEGTVALTAYTFPDCATEGGTPPEEQSDADPSDPDNDPDPENDPGMSTPGCRGAEPTALATGTIN